MVCAIVEMTAKWRGFLSACVIVSVRGSTSCPYPYLNLSARSAFNHLPKTLHAADCRNFAAGLLHLLPPPLTLCIHNA